MANLLDTPALIPEAFLFPTGLSQVIETLNVVNQQAAKIAETFVQINEAVNSMAKQFLEVQRTIESFPFTKMFEQIEEANRRALQFMRLTTTLSFPEIVEGEFEERKQDVSLQQVQIVTTPQTTLLPTPVISLPTKRMWGKMGLKQISGGNFSYRRTTLKGISLRNREGQALALIIASSDLFISDQAMLEKFYAKDTFSRSKIIQLLKDKFKSNSLHAEIERQGDGYILISIHYLQ